MIVTTRLFNRTCDVSFLLKGRSTRFAEVISVHVRSLVGQAALTEKFLAQKAQDVEAVRGYIGAALYARPKALSIVAVPIHQFLSVKNLRSPGATTSTRPGTTQQP